MEDAEELAKCPGCRLVTRTPVLRMSVEGIADSGYTIPVWHKDCIPKDRQSGSNWLRRNKV